MIHLVALGGRHPDRIAASRSNANNARTKTRPICRRDMVSGNIADLLSRLGDDKDLVAKSTPVEVGLALPGSADTARPPRAPDVPSGNSNCAEPERRGNTRRRPPRGKTAVRSPLPPFDGFGAAVAFGCGGENGQGAGHV
jgi:hypothetical protein